MGHKNNWHTLKTHSVTVKAHIRPYTSHSKIILLKVLVYLSRRLKCTIVITRCPSSLTFHIFDFSQTAEQNFTILDMKQELNVLYQICVWANRKTKMATPASDWPTHFQLLLWNHWTELIETWLEARSRRPLPNLFFGPIGKPRWPPQPQIGWNVFYFSSEIAERNSMSSTKFLFFVPIGKPRLPPDL